ncbi:hypothetical protein JL722_8999 [Aureococcus anophagefferens]|nr:hypothetical protein JL722_8999 [Aureococcus anophagefferens]
MFAALSRPFRRSLSRRGVFIQVEKTPNPFSLKFVPSQAVLGEEHQDKSGFHFHRGDTEYLRSPLAKKLFAIDGEDGGDIFFRGFDEATGVVKVELAGSCVGCPSSSVTLRNGVENMLMHYIAEVKAIENVTPDDDADDFKLSFNPPDNPHLSI